MSALDFISFLITFVVGFVAIKKFGLSDEDFLEAFYVTRDEVVIDESVLEPAVKKIEKASKNIEKIEEIRPIKRRRIQGRSKLEVYIDVLWAIDNGINSPVRIMYSANLPWKSTLTILQNLVSQNLVREEIATNKRDKRSKTKYYLAQQGKSMLRYFTASPLLEGKNNLPL